MSTLLFHDVLQWTATNGSDQILETSGQNINILYSLQQREGQDT